MNFFRNLFSFLKKKKDSYNTIYSYECIITIIIILVKPMCINNTYRYKQTGQNEEGGHFHIHVLFELILVGKFIHEPSIY